MTLQSAVDPSGAVHLVGSVPLIDTDKVMRAASSILGSRLRRLPDGETGSRKDFLNWQWPVFAKTRTSRSCHQR
jgi:hypothetical protein